MLRLTGLLFCALFVFAFPLAFADAQDLPPRGKLPTSVLPLHYSLDLEVIPDREGFSGEVTIEVHLLETSERIWMHGRGLDAQEAFLLLEDGSRVEARFEEIEETGVASFTMAEPVGPGIVTMVVRYTAAFNRHLEGLYRVDSGEKAYAFTQFQPLRARMAFPGFDEPRFKTAFDIALTVRSDHVAVSNAPVRETIELENDRKRVVFKPTRLLPTYLIAVAVGDLDVVEWDPIPPSPVRARPIPLRGIAVKGKGPELKYALENTAEMLGVLEDYFGRAYPFAKLDLVAPAEFRSAGMENAGAIFYRPDRILMKDSPSIWQLRGFAGLHFHELAHSWFGNLVTPAWWNDLWLNEAFATWIADRMLHVWQPENYKEHRAVGTAQSAIWSDRLVTARKIRQEIRNDGDISHAFDSITYRKGGGLLTMMEEYVGEEVFRDGVRLFMSQHAYGVANTEDFIAAVSQTAGNPGVGIAFRSFLEQSGTPLVETEVSCRPDGANIVTLRQSRSLPLGSKGDPKRLWSIPICLAYDTGSVGAGSVGEGAGDTAAGRGESCLLLEEATQSLELPGGHCPAWVMPNRGGSGYLNFTLSNSKWQALVDRLGDLPSGEAISAFVSLRAAFQAGRIDAELLLKAAKSGARSPHWDVARQPMQMLRDLKNYYSPRDLRPQVMERLRAIYRPALARFDLSDEGLAADAGNSDDALLRAQVIWFMALDAADPELRKKLTGLAKRYLGYGAGTSPDPSVLHPDLVRAALVAAAGEEDLPFMDFLIEVLRETEDGVLRAHIIQALGYQTERALLERVWQHILDPDTPEWIASELLRRQSNRVDNREAVFDWIVTHYDQLPDRLSHRRMRWLPWRSSAFCSTEGRDRVEAFYSRHAREQDGGKRALRNVLEYIEICAGVAKVQTERTAAVFAD